MENEKKKKMGWKDGGHRERATKGPLNAEKVHLMANEKKKRTFLSLEITCDPLVIENSTFLTPTKNGRPSTH